MKTPKRGRPPKAKDEVLVPVTFRATRPEKTLFKSAAKADRTSPSEWMRRILIAKAKSVIK